METNISRRNLIQNLAFATAGFGLMQLSGCKESKKETNEDKTLKLLTPFYLPPSQPLQPGPGGVDIRTLIRSSQTNMQFSSVEVAVAPKTMGPEPHLHKDLDEIMLVVEGTATVWVNGKVEEIPTNGWHIRPRQIEHTFWNGSDKPLRFIDMYFNQNFEDFLEELFHQIFPDMVKGHLTPADPAIVKRLNELNMKFGITSFPEKRQPLIEKYGLKG